MRISLLSSALVAALVGYGSTIALVLAAARALGATPAQTESWIFAVCLAKATGSALLSGWTRAPVVLAWSTPGAALVAASHGFTMTEGVGAFVVTGGLVALTGLIGPLGRLVARIPAATASAMLAGVLLPFCLKVPPVATALPLLILPVILAFALVRLASPAFAVLAALAAGLALTFGQGTPLPEGFARLPRLTFILPDWSAAATLGLALPLYLVTMASQNLPGFAVLRGAGYEPPVRRALGVTGILSAIAGFFGAHTISMAAITAAICLGEEVHPDRSRRWMVGLAYAAAWAGLGIFGTVILSAIDALPPELVTTVAGLALIGPLMGSLAAAFGPPQGRFPAAVTLMVTASGVSAFGIGGAFWGILAGLAAGGLDGLGARVGLRR
ncbi:MAG: benzoate/H(+) symporter BenE family transporter [Proteobacteria bacterium]|nr:benzoate/H(+) symporter BenE family transporter [Pseudomonadota bacterium]MBS0572226.1 benzoate/H(+) symporter BenE family transporter [Pseudomonadota bacterium]